MGTNSGSVPVPGLEFGLARLVRFSLLPLGAGVPRFRAFNFAFSDVWFLSERTPRARMAEYSGRVLDKAFEALCSRLWLGAPSQYNIIPLFSILSPSTVSREVYPPYDIFILSPLDPLRHYPPPHPP